MSLRLLIPTSSAAQRAHRALLTNSRPGRSKASSCALLAARWLWWIGFGARQAVRQSLVTAGSELERTHDLSRRRQRRELWWLAMVHGIAPLNYYYFEMYQPTGPPRWAWVFDNEASAFHHDRDNHHRPAHGASDRTPRLDPLADKHAAIQAFAAHGLLVAPTMSLLTKGAKIADLPETADQQMVAKPRRGSGSRGVFRFRRSDTVLQVFTLNGNRVDPDAQERFVESRLASRPFIVQPYFETHPDLEPLGTADQAAVTVRIITERGQAVEDDRDDEATDEATGEATDEVIRVDCAYLEVPFSGVQNRASWVALAIDIEMGTIDGLAGPPLSDSDEQQRLADAARGVAVPGWSDAVSAARRAHRLTPRCFALAWDFVVSPQGPVLLEGNSNWSLVVPQQIRGPLLARQENQ